MSLDMGLLLAGAKERGELETRVTSLIEETRSAGLCLLGLSHHVDLFMFCCRKSHQQVIIPVPLLPLL